MDLHLERYLLKNRVERLSGGENDFINGSSPAAGMVDYATIIKPGEAIGKMCIRDSLRIIGFASRWRESNPRPADYKSAALAN